MSHGDQVHELPRRIYRRWRPRPPAPMPRPSIARGRFMACSSIPKSPTRRAASRSSRTSSTRSATAKATGRWGTLSSNGPTRARAGRHGKVICGLSGGVDSSVVAALLHKAIGDQLVCIFVDNGLLRKNERELVESTFRDHFKINLRHQRCQRAISFRD